MVVVKKAQRYKRPLVDVDGFRWWLEEDDRLWPDRLSVIEKELY